MLVRVMPGKVRGKRFVAIARPSASTQWSAMWAS